MAADYLGVVSQGWLPGRLPAEIKEEDFSLPRKKKYSILLKKIQYRKEEFCKSFQGKRQICKGQ